jgi:hypothetical protein
VPLDPDLKGGACGAHAGQKERRRSLDEKTFKGTTSYLFF